MKPRWKLSENRQLNQIHAQIDRLSTFKQFGYYPEELSPSSSKLVVWRCLKCDFESQSRQNKIGSGNCFSCRQRIKTINRNAKAISSGMAPNGNPLGINHDKKRKTAATWRKQWRSTPIGCLTNRLRVSLKRVHKGYSTKNLPYTSTEYTAHILHRLEQRNHICPLCKVTKIDYNTCDIDHVIPLCTANTPEEALKLFALSNLDVLCPDCNQFVKADRILVY